MSAAVRETLALNALGRGTFLRIPPAALEEINQHKSERETVER